MILKQNYDFLDGKKKVQTIGLRKNTISRKKILPTAPFITVVAHFDTLSQEAT